MVAPVVEKLAEEYEGRFKVGKLNVDGNRQIAGKFGIMAIPSLLMFKGGQVAKKVVGVKSKRELQVEMDGLLE